METKTNRELTEQVLALETYTKVYLPKQLKDADAKIEETDARIPDTTSEDVGKFIGVNSNGDLAVVEAVNSLPAVTTAENGRALTVVGGAWAVPTIQERTLSIDITDPAAPVIHSNISHTTCQNLWNGRYPYILFKATLTVAESECACKIRANRITNIIAPTAPDPTNEYVVTSDPFIIGDNYYYLIVFDKYRSTTISFKLVKI